jgi:hypothetical protein
VQYAEHLENSWAEEDRLLQMASQVKREVQSEIGKRTKWCPYIEVVEKNKNKNEY